jgi:hypothetical protein
LTLRSRIAATNSLPAAPQLVRLAIKDAYLCGEHFPAARMDAEAEASQIAAPNKISLGARFGGVDSAPDECRHRSLPMSVGSKWEATAGNMPQARRRSTSHKYLVSGL